MNKQFITGTGTLPVMIESKFLYSTQSTFMYVTSVNNIQPGSLWMCGCVSKRRSERLQGQRWSKNIMFVLVLPQGLLPLPRKPPKRDTQEAERSQARNTSPQRTTFILPKQSIYSKFSPGWINLACSESINTYLVLTSFVLMDPHHPT